MTPATLKKHMRPPDWVRYVDPHAHGYPSYMERAVERRQLDESIEALPATVGYLYSEFTPTTTAYPAGTRPLLEMIVDAVCDRSASDVDRALRLVTAHKIVGNYDYLGHVNQQPPSSFVDLDAVVRQWQEGTFAAKPREPNPPIRRTRRRC